MRPNFPCKNCLVFASCFASTRGFMWGNLRRSLYSKCCFFKEFYDYYVFVENCSAHEFVKEKITIMKHFKCNDRKHLEINIENLGLDKNCFDYEDIE